MTQSAHPDPIGQLKALFEKASISAQQAAIERYEASDRSNLMLYNLEMVACAIPQLGRNEGALQVISNLPDVDVTIDLVPLPSGFSSWMRQCLAPDHFKKLDTRVTLLSDLIARGTEALLREIALGAEAPYKHPSATMANETIQAINVRRAPLPEEAAAIDWWALPNANYKSGPWDEPEVDLGRVTAKLIDYDEFAKLPDHLQQRFRTQFNMSNPSIRKDALVRFEVKDDKDGAMFIGIYNRDQATGRIDPDELFGWFDYQSEWMVDQNIPEEVTQAFADVLDVWNVSQTLHAPTADFSQLGL